MKSVKHGSQMGRDTTALPTTRPIIDDPYSQDIPAVKFEPVPALPKGFSPSLKYKKKLPVKKNLKFSFYPSTMKG